MSMMLPSPPSSEEGEVEASPLDGFPPLVVVVGVVVVGPMMMMMMLMMMKW